MHPAYSIILFTTLSGTGYGLAAFLGTGLMAPSVTGGLIAYGLAGLMITGGLISSTFHLRHPERAWRAFSQWRSSWLSREGVLAVIFFAPFGVAGVGVVFLGEFWRPFGLVTILLAVMTVYATSMIYGSLRSVHAWYTPLTSLCYLAFAASGGALLFLALATPFGGLPSWMPGLSGGLVLLAWLIKGIWWRRLATERSASTQETATGLGELGPVRMLDPPHTEANYLMREMGFAVGRKHAGRLKAIALIFGLVIPVGALALGGDTPSVWAAAWAAIAAVSHFAGLLVERWLFFAEARHTVMLYYGREAA